MKRIWTTRSFEQGDEERIFELWQSVNPKGEFNREKWMAWWVWKYWKNPAGKPIIWLALDQDRLIGHYAIIPIRMRIGNEIIVGSQSVDTMTHPDYRHQGIFETLASKTYEQAVKEEVHIIYGFPNRFSYPGFVNKLGWFDISVLHTMIMPLNLTNVLRKYIQNKYILHTCAVGGNLLLELLHNNNGTSRINKVKTHPISAFDERVDYFWDKISSLYQITVVRDKSYLNWRFADMPNTNPIIYTAEKDKEILGFIVLTTKSVHDLKFGYIADVAALPSAKHTYQDLISTAMWYFSSQKVDLISYQGIGNKACQRTLMKNGFLFSRFIDKRFHFIARVNTSKVSDVFLKNSRHWFVQRGDADSM